jgi:hypothetical protein
VKYKSINELKRESEDVVLLCTGASLNDINDKTWKWILEQDTLAVNNFVYHPWVVPKWNHLEIKSYDFPYEQKYLEVKWNDGWKNVGYIFPTERADYISSCIGHNEEAKLFTYNFHRRGQHPKVNPNVVVDANFNPNDGKIYKSYDTSMSSIFQILYLMNYNRIIIYGMDMTTSAYFWTTMDIDVHDRWNKAREGKTVDKPHNAGHLKNYVIDFNERHMKPKGREILVGHKTTALYPSLRLLER